MGKCILLNNLIPLSVPRESPCWPRRSGQSPLGYIHTYMFMYIYIRRCARTARSGVPSRACHPSRSRRLLVLKDYGPHSLHPPAAATCHFFDETFSLLFCPPRWSPTAPKTTQRGTHRRLFFTHAKPMRLYWVGVPLPALSLCT